ncbi:MAG TPA: C4-type zinc ribbon domain-containing protein [Terriglobia bacterium]|nr:C4-type zinc ribbon domain-containing protein [Terriglobia bacterium]
MHPELKSIIELQQVDTAIAELSAQIGALPAQVSAFESQLHEFLQRLEDRKQRLTHNQKERKELEVEIQQIQARISKHRDQLYEVKTNEQYKAMLHEIAGEEANIRKIEDRILEKMMEADELQGPIREAESHLAEEKARVAGETARLKSLQQADIDERNKLQARRAELAGSLSENLLQTYERVRGGRGGRAVAEVRDGFCTACHVALRPQLYNEVRSNEALIACESCSRILYYVEPPAEEPQPADAQNGAARDQAAAHS